MPTVPLLNEENEYDRILKERPGVPGNALPVAGPPAEGPPVAGAGGNEYDQILAERTGAAKSALQRSLYVAGSSSPDEEAGLITLSKKTGTPVEALREPAVVREAERAIRALENPPDRLAEQSPGAAAWLSNPDNARLAHDDIPSLAQKEADASTLRAVKVFFTEDIPNIATSYGARMGAQIEQGVGGILRYVGERAEQLDPGRKSPLTKAGSDLFAEGKAIMEVVEQEKPLTTRGGKILGGVTDSVGAMLPAVGAGLVTLNPGVGLGVMGLTTAGQSYGEKREAGKPFGTSLKSALWQGGAEVATETLPFLKLAKWLKPGKMSRKVAEYLAAEIPGEMIATALQNPADLYFDEENPEKAREKVVEYLTSRQFAQDEIDTVLTTVAQGFIMGAPFAAGQMGSAAYEKRRAKSQGAALDALLSTEGSKLAQRSPDAYGDAIQKIAEEKGVGTVYLQADRMVEVLQEQGLSTPEIVAWAEDMGVSREDLDTALVTGSAVEMRVGDIAGRQAADPYLPMFRKDWRIDPAYPSESAVDGAVLAESDAVQRVSDLMAEEPASSDRRVYEDVLAQLTLAGQAPDEASRAAEAWQAHYRTRTQRRNLGEDPFALYLERRVRITASPATAPGIEGAPEGVPEGATFSQTVTPPEGFPAERNELRVADRVWEPEVVLSADESTPVPLPGGFPKHKYGLNAKAIAIWANVEGMLLHPDVGLSADEGVENARLVEKGILTQEENEKLKAFLKNVSTSENSYTIQDMTDEQYTEYENGISQIADMAVRDILSLHDTAPGIEGIRKARELGQPGQPGEPLAVLTGKELGDFGEDRKSLRAAAVSWYKDNLQGTYAEREDIGKIRFSGKGRKEFIYYGAEPDKLRMVVALKDLIENGDYVRKKELNKPRADGIVAFHIVDGDLTVSGNLFRARVYIGEDAKGNLFYQLATDAAAEDVKKRRDGGREPNPGSSRREGGKTTLDQSITPDDDGVNIRILPQEGGKDRRGFIRFGPAGEVEIGLLEKANLSTFLHETGHAWLEELRADAALEGASEQLRDDWKTVSEYLGIADLAPRAAIPTESHETFARSVEAYLMEGKAPSAELASTFTRFKAWLVQVYREISRLGVKLTPEVRGVLDRLVATDEEIEAARKGNLQVPLLGKADLEQHATPEEVTRYRKAAGEASSDAVESLDRHRVAGLEKRLMEWRAWAEDTVSNDRLRKNIDEISAGPGIDRESLRRLLGDEGMTGIPENSDAGLWRAGGLDVEHAAARAGFKDARRFVDAVLAAGTKEEAIHALVDALEAGWKDKYDAQEAIRTAAARRQMEIESRIMARAASGKAGHAKAKPGERFQTVSWDALRMWAEQKILREKLSDAIGIHKLLLTSRRLRREAMAAAKKKNWEEAFLANERARLNEALIAEHYKAQKAFRRMRDDWKAAIKTDIDTEYRDQLNRLLMKFHLTEAKLPVAEGAPSLATFYADKSSDSDEIGVLSSFAAPEWIVEGEPRQISQMTWLEVNELHETISWLVGRGREEQKATIAADGKTVEEAIAACLEGSEGLKKITPPKDTSFLHGLRKLKKRYFADLVKIARQMKWMDGFVNIRAGGKAGANEALLLNPILKGLGLKFREAERLNKLLEPHIKQLQTSARRHPGELTHVRNPESLSRYGKPWTFERVVALALNMGTQENRTRIEAGYWLRAGEMEQIVSILTEADWRAIEGIQTAIGTMFPKIAEVHAKINHFPLKKVRGMKFSVRTAEGKLIEVQGGYYPLRYDGDILRKIGGWTEKDELLNRHGAVLQTPRAKKGFTETRRKNVVMPVKLSLSVLAEHIEDVTTYAHMAIPIRDADRVTRHDAYMERAEDVMGKEMADQIRPALKDILRREGRRMSSAEQAIAWSRRMTSLYYIGWNFWTSAQNLVNIFPVLMVGGRKVFADGLLDIYSRPGEAHKEILAKSAYMAQRSDAIDREMVGKLRNFKPRVEVKGVTLEDLRDASYALMKATDTMYTVPMWQGAYSEGLLLYEGNEEKAILHADDKVRSVFGSGLTVDMARIQRDPGVMSLLTQFASWFMTQQQLMAASWQAMKAGKITKRQFAYDYAMVMVFPSLASTFLFSLLTKAELPEWKEIFGDQWSYLFGGLPGVRDIVPSAQAIFGHSRRPPAGVRIPATDIAKDVQKFTSDAVSGEWGRLAWDFAKLVSFATGIPATRIYERWERGSKQDLPQNVLIPARD